MTNARAFAFQGLASDYTAADMRFEKATEIDAPQQRVWNVLTDLEAWPQRTETVMTLEAESMKRASETA